MKLTIDLEKCTTRYTNGNKHFGPINEYTRDFDVVDDEGGYLGKAEIVVKLNGEKVANLTCENLYAPNGFPVNETVYCSRI